MKPRKETFEGHFTTETHSSHMTHNSPKGDSGKLTGDHGIVPTRSNSVEGFGTTTTYPKSYGGPIAQIQRGKGTQHVTPGTKPPKGVNTK